ncbi:MerR family transcriptional regulator [Putridiphycobacter roseus]|uniref:MerR family transcriptional regulator n=1 Tax=Putridiphycobacter roseus TaxID=2219161 RepID=A0A2W1MXQ0_9FLAO|nr:chaperone modulator CbpM [Putridiphycobacter roseus]PZE15950.1 MerR family transcriptional regulator [Putridiphycobacter roseus]
MEAQFIPTRTICLHYEIEITFVKELNQYGLIEIEEKENEAYIHQDQIADLEKILRLYNELKVNLEGIDVVLNLLKKEEALQEELNTLRNRLSLYENE